MIQKIFSLTIVISGFWALQRFEPLIPILIIGIAVAMYRGADHGLWFHIGRRPKCKAKVCSTYKERDYTDLNGRGD